MRVDSKCLMTGAAAGLLGGGVLIVLFILFDGIRGDPLATPTFLADSLFGDPGAFTPGRVALFAVAHFAVFVVLGMIAAVVVETTGVPRNLFVGAAYGLFGCSLVFYSALVISDASLLGAPAWPIVLSGNVVAGVVIVEVLRRAGPERGITAVFGDVVEHRVFREGLVAGLLGAVVVALWFFIVDSVIGRPLYTPAALGSALLHGTSASDAVQISAGVVLGYSLFHVAAFVILGLIASALVTQAERFPPLVFLLLILLVVFETFFVLLVAMLGIWLLEELAWWSVLIGNLLAAAVMGRYLWMSHPGLRAKLRDEVLWAER